MRLKTLIWLAAQAVKAEAFWWGRLRIRGTGVTGGSNNQKLVQDIYGYGVAMKHIFHRLDGEALLLVEGTRSKQKAAFS